MKNLFGIVKSNCIASLKFKLLYINILLIELLYKNNVTLTIVLFYLISAWLCHKHLQIFRMKTVAYVILIKFILFPYSVKK